MGSETRARLAFGGLLAATLISFELLFETDGYVGPVLLACLLAMAVGGLARRWGAGPILTFEVSLACLFWYLAVVFQASKTFFGLPTPDAATGIARLVTSAMEASVVDYAPIPVRAGYVVMVVVGFWLATTIGEIAAFRWRRPVIASLAPLSLFAIAMITGTGSGTLFFLTLFLIALLTFWASESSHRLRSWGRWVSTWDHHKADEPQQVTSALARRMGASCIAVTLVAPIFLPTIGEGWLPWRNDTGEGPGGGGGGDINLLVDIAPQLLEQTDTHLFTVRAEEPAYWRLASLVRFDGRFWHEIDEERVAIEQGEVRDLRFDRLIQDFDITGLEGRFLPAAVEPIALEGEEASWVEEGDTFDLAVEDEVEEGTEYRVTSAVADPTYKELKEADVADAPDSAYTATVESVTPGVRSLLEEWTRGARTPFEKLVSIQSHLRSAEFTYQEDVGQSESDNYLEDFLLETRAGFCQQFSTAFALLARELGYPTRVSVGFLPGTQENTGDGSMFTVRGTDAHAWPEVKFDNYGWIAFEPTARSLSSQPDYTIAPEAPDVFREGETGNAPSRGPAPDDPTAQARNPEGPTGSPRTETSPRASVEDTAWQSAFLRLALVLLAAVLAWAVAVPLLKAQRNKRRFRAARTPAAAAIAAYRQFEDDAAEMFDPRSPAESAAAYAQRIGNEAHRVPPRPAERLATLYELAAYSSAGVTDKQAAEARRVARELASALWSRSTIWERARRLFSVRSLLSGLDLGLERRRTRPAAG